jgi:hypothetical protein
MELTDQEKTHILKYAAAHMDRDDQEQVKKFKELRDNLYDVPTEFSKKEPLKSK